MDSIPIWLQDTTTKEMTQELCDAIERGDCEAVRDTLVSGKCHIHSVRYIPPCSTFFLPISVKDAILKLTIICTFNVAPMMFS